MTSYQESDAASREDAAKSSLGCLIPAIAATIILALAVTLVSWLVLVDDEVDAPASAETETTAPAQPDRSDPSRSGADRPNSSKKSKGSKASARSVDVSSDALLAVIESQGFAEFGRPEIIDLGSQRQVVHKFRRDREHLQVTVHSYNDASKARALRKKTRRPARAVRFGTKVVVVEPLTDDSDNLVGPLVDKLRDFHDILAEDR